MSIRVEKFDPSRKVRSGVKNLDPDPKFSIRGQKVDPRARIATIRALSYQSLINFWGCTRKCEFLLAKAAVPRIGVWKDFWWKFPHLFWTFRRKVQKVGAADFLTSDREFLTPDRKFWPRIENFDSGSKILTSDRKFRSGSKILVRSQKFGSRPKILVPTQKSDPGSKIWTPDRNFSIRGRKISIRVENFSKKSKSGRL